MLTQSFIFKKILIRFFKFIFFNPFTYILIIMDGLNPFQPSFFMLTGMLLVIIIWLFVNLYRWKTRSFTIVQCIVSQKFLVPGSGDDFSSCYIRFHYKGNQTIMLNCPYGKYKSINPKDIYYLVFSSLENKKICWVFPATRFYSIGSDLEHQYIKLDQKEGTKIDFTPNDIIVSQLTLHKNEKIVRWPWASSH